MGLSSGAAKAAPEDPPRGAAASGGDGAPERPPARHARWEGERVERWARWWGIAGLEAHHTLPSTSETLRARAMAGAPAWTVVTAQTQSAGRGRGGNRWHSPPGMGLWFSVLLRPEDGALSLPVLPLRVGLALARTVEVVAPGVSPRLKWPNDLWIGDRKAAGILCEMVNGAPGGPAVVLGVGVNLRQKPADFPADVRRSAISLADAAGFVPDMGLMLGTFLSLLRQGLVGAGPLLGPGERGDLAARDALAGRRVRVDPGGEGVAVGIGEDGALLLDQGGDTVRRVMAGSVRLQEPSSGGGRT